MIRWQWTPYEALTLDALYAALALRQRVFVVEQNCPYLDADGDDALCHHLLGWGGDDQLDAYLRVYPPHTRRPEIIIGRVITAPRVRRQGLGRHLMETGMRLAFETWGPNPIYLSAQVYLLDFYTALGFNAFGPHYEEDGIPHVAMKRSRSF